MKQSSLIVACAMFIWNSLYGTPDVCMEVYRFNATTSAYIEVSIYVAGSSLIADTMQVRHLPNNFNNLAASTSPDYKPNKLYGIEYVILIKDELNHIVAGNRYKLSREGFSVQDIFDVKRFTLPSGKYTIDLEANDLTDTLSQLTITQQVEIPALNESASLSDIQLLSTIQNQPEGLSPFHKSGLYLEPMAFRLYYPALNQLSVYLETYHTDQVEGQAYLQYTIKPISGEIPPPIVTYKKVKKEPVAPNVLQLDISSLITGTYLLEASLFDGNKQLKETKQVAFTRLNPTGDSIFMESAALQLESSFVNNIPEDSLDYNLKAIAPIVNSLDVEVMNTLLKKGSARSKRYFLHKYWTTLAGKHAEVAYKSYMDVARLVDELFRSGFGYGFETDRGHVFLKYGKPNDVITVEDEPSAPPYEIWFYNTFPATHQTNVRFLFYNPSLVRNGHELLHSTANGEVSNARWETELYRDATQETPGVNERVMGDNVHRNARTYFQY
jgi:GWxTD domain-containing protein